MAECRRFGAFAPYDLAPRLISMSPVRLVVSCVLFSSGLGDVKRPKFKSSFGP
jgi:hypothetical protein